MKKFLFMLMMLLSLSMVTACNLGMGGGDKTEDTPSDVTSTPQEEHIHNYPLFRYVP